MASKIKFSFCFTKLVKEIQMHATVELYYVAIIHVSPENYNRMVHSKLNLQITRGTPT